MFAKLPDSSYLFFSFQNKKNTPKFNTRKAGEGSDIDPKWKKTYAYKKERETHEDEEEEVSQLSRKQKQKHPKGKFLSSDDKDRDT